MKISHFKLIQLKKSNGEELLVWTADQNFQARLEVSQAVPADL